MTMQVLPLSLTNFSADEQDIVIGSVRNKTIGKMIKYFDKIKWTTTAVSDLEKSVLGGDIGHYCVTSAVVCAHKYSPLFFSTINRNIERSLFWLVCHELDHIFP